MSSVLDPKNITFDEDTKEPSLKQEEVSPALSTSDISFYEEPSTLSDLGLGAAQGATFGFSDELMAALQAAKEVATTEKTLKDLPSLYRQLQEVEQQKIAEARERSPIAFTAGEMGAGILPALFTGGATAAASGARAAAAGAKAAPGFLRSVMGAAKAGAGYGALATAGTTEKPIEDTGEFVSEVAKGGLAGATIGGALGTAGQAAKALSGSLEGHQFAEQAKLAYKTAKEDIPIFGKEGMEYALEREKKGAISAAEKLLEGKELSGKNIEKVLKKSTELFKDKDLATDITELTTDIPKRVRTELQEYADKLAAGDLSAEELHKMKRIANETLFEHGEKLLPDSYDKLKTISDFAEENLQTIKGYSKATKRHFEYLSAMPETILSKGVPEKFREQYISDLARPKKQLYNELTSLIRSIARPGASVDEKSKTFMALKENVKLLKEKDPSLFKKIKMNPDEIIQSLEKEADLSAISQAMRGYEPETGAWKQFFNLFTPRGATFSAASAAGKTAGAIGRSTPVKVAGKIASTAEPKLRSMAEKLMSNPATRNFGESLAGSLDKPGTAARRAALLSIMQQSAEARRIASEEE